MKEDKPEKKKSKGVNKIYQRKEYSIYKVANGFIIHNTKKKFEEGHTHLKSFNMCKTLIDCCIRKKLPKTRNHYLLESVIRISDDKSYSKKVEELLEVRKHKGKQSYTIKK